MKVITTNILDSNLVENNQASKILLFDNLLEHFAPLFYEETRKKQEQFSNNVADIAKLRNVISEYRKHLLKLKSDLAVESLKNKILREIEYLSSVDVIYGKIKTTISETISTLENQPIVELEKRLALLQRITRERTKKG